MQICVVAVYDNAAGAFGRPFFVNSKGLAIRSFSDEVNRASDDNQLYMHPDDFVLHLIAMWDDDTGTFSVPDDVGVISRGSFVKIVKS